MRFIDYDCRCTECNRECSPLIRMGNAVDICNFCLLSACALMSYSLVPGRQDKSESEQN